MICWYCHWGWPKQVADIYKKAVREIDAMAFPDDPAEVYEEDGERAMDFGPAHIVWADENWDDSDIEYCIEVAKSWEPERGMGGDAVQHPEVLAVVIRSLEELRAVPEEIRMCEPDDYDGAHPENFPPPTGIEMVKCQ